jgi:DNA-binding NtrC family response regulator
MKNESISILCADDEENFLTLVHASLIQEGYAVDTASDGISAINKLQLKPYDIVLLDVKMPHVDGVEVLRFAKNNYLDTQVIMLSGVNDVRVAVQCMQLGAYHYITKPYSVDELLSVIDRALERKRLVIENKVLRSKLARHGPFGNIVGSSKSILDVLTIASKVAPTDSSVLLQGASGTGKELIANFLHQNSLRKDLPIVALNCASIPEALIESELFGHEKGAFTDAIATKQGLVEITNGGTLFLDEIAEISLIMQPKLLRFLQTGEYRRVGGNRNMRADVRVISASNKELLNEVKANRFREDLLYRLNVITLHLPTLKERPEDIPALVDYFLKERVRSRNVNNIDPKALDLLTKYEWPGNIRELENVIERAAILCQDNTIRVEDLALPLRSRPMTEQYVGGSSSGVQVGSAVSMTELEKAHIAGVLKIMNWNKNTAAKILGISLKTLYTKIQQHNLTKE